jgi:hypothetical protein
MKRSVALFGILVFAAGTSVAQFPGQPTPVPPSVQGGPPAAPVAWWSQMEELMPILGEGNWIVIADANFPWLAGPGIETVNTSADAPRVLSTVLAQLEKTGNLRANVVTETEFDFVPEQDVKGVTAYRDALKKALGNRPLKTMGHEEIVGKILETGKSLHVLVLKTNSAVPYSTLFLEIQGGKWNPDAEKRLRDAMKLPKPAPSAAASATPIKKTPAKGQKTKH